MTQKIVSFHGKQPQIPFLTKIPSVHNSLHLFQFKVGILEFRLNALIISFNFASIASVSVSPSIETASIAYFHSLNINFYLSILI